jgi:sigma-B regulation protein RsbU (phosphoserine phosphatase)
MKQAESYLMRVAKDQADMSNALLEKVEGEVGIITNFAHTIMLNPLPSPYGDSSEGHPISLDHVAPGVEISAAKKELELWRGLDAIFVPILSGDSNLTWIYFGTESGIMHLYPWTSDLPSSYDPRIRNWYLGASSAGKVSWSELYVDAGGKGLMITCSKPVYDEKNKLVGVVAADVTLSTLNEAIINTQVGTLGYAFMIDETGEVIARPGLTAGDKRWDESFTTENLTLSDDPQLRAIAGDMIAGNIGINIANFQDVNKYIAYAPVITTKWSIGITMPINEIIAPALATKSQIISGALETRAGIDRKINAMRYIFIANLVGAILLVTILALLLSRTITRPILKVTNAARAVEKGEIREEEITGLSQTKGQDEVSILSRVFASMVAQVKARENFLKKQVEELRIEIDQVKKANEVKQITESDYFQRLRETAKKIRDKGKK